VHLLVCVHLSTHAHMCVCVYRKKRLKFFRRRPPGKPRTPANAPEALRGWSSAQARLLCACVCACVRMTREEEGTHDISSDICCSRFKYRCLSASLRSYPSTIFLSLPPSPPPSPSPRFLSLIYMYREREKGNARHFERHLLFKVEVSLPLRFYSLV